MLLVCVCVSQGFHNSRTVATERKNPTNIRTYFPGLNVVNVQASNDRQDTETQTHGPSLSFGWYR